MLEEKTDIIAPEEPDALELYKDQEQFNALIANINAVVEETRFDLTTDKGRREIASLSRKIARVKVAVDEAGKKLGDDARATLASINETRKGYRETLQALQDASRAPLTEWEQKEAERKSKEDRFFGVLKNGSLIRAGASVRDIEAQIETVRALVIDPAVLGARIEEATIMRDQCVTDLSRALDEAKRAEADRAELDRLRKAEADRLRQEEAAKAAAVKAPEPALSPAPVTRESTRADFAAMGERIDQAKAESPLDKAANAIRAVVDISEEDAKTVVKAICARRVPHLQWKD